MSITSKLTTVVVGFALVAAMAFTFAVPSAHAALTASQIQSILSLLQSFGADQTTINNVNASLTGQPTTPVPSTPSSSSCSAFTRDLTVGSTGADVMDLQRVLNGNGYPVASSGAGAPGSESTYFGAKTQAALAKWQAANGISPAAGYFGPITRAKLASSCTTTPGPVTTVPGTGISVAAGSQPQNALAPEGATRVPFTRVTLTASNNGPVTVNSLTVQRTGLGQNAAFAGVVLIDQDGNQLGTAKTFNSNDQATVGEAVVIPAGQSRTFTVAGNMAASLDSYAGEAPAISVVGVNTSATISGSFPITGAYHTTNATLTVGSITLAASTAFSTNANATKEIGTTNFKTTGVRLTAGSAEDLRLKMLRFNQTGSASTVNDLANIKVVVDGTAYPATVSSDGKYVTANLGSGVLISEGNSVEVYVQYDVIGSNSSGRTVIFDVDKTTDIFAEGVTYGYGISPAAGGSSVPTSRGTFTVTSGTPYIYSNQVTISGASVTTIGKDNGVPAQNIAVNLANQPLGGFEVDIKGEAVTVQSMVFTVASSSGSGTGLLTNVTLVDENGSVVAGPVDASGAGTSLTFTDSVTFPIGKHKYALRGKVASGIGNGTIYTLSTNPSSQWTNVKGDITGNTITLTQSSFTMNAMTVKTAALAVGRATSPASQTIVAGGSDVLFVNFQLDASQSGEDVRLSSFPFSLTFGATSVDTDLSSCKFYDGTKALNTGSNVVNPGDATATTSAYTGTATFDDPVQVAKGSVKTLGLKCNVTGSATSGGTYAWDHDTITNFSATGATSGNSITETQLSDSAVTVTIGSGTITVAEDSSSPAEYIARADTTDNLANAIRISTTNEGFNLTKLGLTLTNSASSSAGDLVKVSIFDGATKVGEAFFSGTQTTATSTLSQVINVPKNSSKVLTLKADFTGIGQDSSDSAVQGHLIAVDYLNGEGTGSESGATTLLGASNGSTSASGVRLFNAFPRIARLAVPSTTLVSGTQDLYRFSITSDAKVGDFGLSLYKLTLNIATSAGNATVGTSSITNLKVFAYQDAGFGTAVSGFTDGQVVATVTALPSSGDNDLVLSSPLVIPAGSTFYFKVRGDATFTTGTGTHSHNVTTKISGDGAYPVLAASTFMAKATSIDSDTNDDFIWSPNATTTSGAGHIDWTNGYLVSGFSGGETDVTILSK